MVVLLLSCFEARKKRWQHEEINVRAKQYLRRLERIKSISLAIAATEATIRSKLRKSLWMYELGAKPSSMKAVKKNELPLF